MTRLSARGGFLTLPEAAGQHKTKQWLRDFLRDRPFGRMAGRVRLFTEGDVAAIIEAALDGGPQ